MKKSVFYYRFDGLLIIHTFNFQNHYQSMKNYFLLTLLCYSLLTSCKSDPNTEKLTDQTNTESADNTIIDEIQKDSADIQKKEWFLYEGMIGDYYQHVVFVYRIEGDSIYGQYYYSKHQKALKIIGKYDKKQNQYLIQESYKGKNTGFLQLSNINGKLKGTWKKSAKESESQQVILNFLDQKESVELPYKFVHETIKDPHQVYIYNGINEDTDTIEVVDELHLSKINSNYYSFAYSVTGGNGHIGSVNGIIKMKNDTIGIFRGEDECEMLFKILPNEIIIEENDCGYYHGAHAYFDNRLKNRL